MHRRAFLKTAAAGAAGLAAAAGPAPAAEVRAAKTGAQLKLCSQEGRLPGKTLREKIENLVKFGGCGIEFHRNARGRIKEIRAALKGTGVGVAAICAGYFPIVDPDPEKRKAGCRSLKEVCSWAGDLGSTGVILVPAFRNHPTIQPYWEARKVFVENLHDVGEHAAKAGTRVLLEPLNRGEATFLRLLADAAAICRDARSPGACMMGDFYHMNIEETSDEGAFLSAGPYLHHVHLASRVRWLPGQDHLKEPNKPERSFVSGFRGLKRIGYRDYCSLECGCKGDPMVEIPKSFAFLRRQWEEATI